jgi:hypothetical protein
MSFKLVSQPDLQWKNDLLGSGGMAGRIACALNDSLTP